MKKYYERKNMDLPWVDEEKSYLPNEDLHHGSLDVNSISNITLQEDIFDFPGVDGEEKYLPDEDLQDISLEVDSGFDIMSPQSNFVMDGSEKVEEPSQLLFGECWGELC